MSRIRSIKPEFWTDDAFADLTDAHQLLYIGLWQFADDSWRFEWRPRRIKAFVFPFRPDYDIDAMLDALLAAEKLIRYEVDGHEYGFLPGCADHQVVNRPTASKLPPPPAAMRDSVTAHGGLTEDSSSRAPGTEGTEGTEGSNTMSGNGKPDAATIAKIVSRLNERAGTSFRAETKQTKALIRARFADGFTADDFQTVIDSRCALWRGDAKMAEFLRPATLFGTKFECYLNHTKRPDEAFEL
jgi:uncharacterized phage protein (TIGR02220 family)